MNSDRLSQRPRNSSDPGRLKICVFGAGATGGNLAVRLHEVGHQVSAVARGAQGAAIRSAGLRLRAGDAERHAAIACSEYPADLGPQDLVIVSVKATALSGIAPGLAALIGPETAVIFAQNGVPFWYPFGRVTKVAPSNEPGHAIREALGAVVSPDRIVGGVLTSGNRIVEPGVVENTTPDRNRLDIGPVVARSRVDISALRAILEGAGFLSATFDEDIRLRLWTKLVYNMSASTLALATGEMSSICRTDPALAVLFRRLMAEAMAIAASEGFDLAHRVDVAQVQAAIPDHRPSLLQDYEAGRPMEVAEIVLAPQAFARRAGIETPVLDTVAAIVAQKARARGTALSGSLRR